MWQIRNQEISVQVRRQILFAVVALQTSRQIVIQTATSICFGRPEKLWPRSPGGRWAYALSTFSSTVADTTSRGAIARLGQLTIGTNTSLGMDAPE
jgi:hypothetical protein